VNLSFAVFSRLFRLRQKIVISPARGSSPPTNWSADPNRRESTAQQVNARRSTARASQKGCKAICDWIGAEGLSGPAGAQIVGEARQTLAVNEENKTLPRDSAPLGMPITEIVRRCRPAEPNTDTTSYIAWFGHWLSLWAAYSMTDSWVRYKAIELALEIQLRR
jgi:hypothetical protein